MAYIEAHTAVLHSLLIHNRSLFLILYFIHGMVKFVVWFEKRFYCLDMACMLICRLSQIYRVNNLQHHMGLRTVLLSLQVLIHSRLFVVFISDLRVCVCAWMRMSLKGFSWFMISAQNPSKLNRREDRGREKYRGRSVTEETEMSGGEKRETECRSGLGRLLHEGGPGSTANYA